MKIALISLDQVWENKEKNLAKCEKLLKVASKNCVELAIFPEMTLTGYTLNANMAEEYESSKTIESFRSMSLRYNTRIVFGLSVKEDDKLLNRLVMIGKNGDVTCFYDKIHPFSFAKEDLVFKAGEAPRTVQIDDAGVSFSICYDLRFPEIFSMQAKKTALYINIANWPKSRVTHFKTLLKARAIENQAFVIGVNRVGSDKNGIKYTKSSLCYDPCGARVVPITYTRELDIIDIEVSEVEKQRNNFTCVADKRAPLYNSLMLKA